MTWRSLLFVPGNRPDFAEKAPRCQPDAVVLDLEDAVPPLARPDARIATQESAAMLASQGIDVLVRVNPPTTPWYADDISALPLASLKAIVIPKLESPDALTTAAMTVPLPLIGGFETVRGVTDALDLLERGLAGCYFGAEDYTLDLGGHRTPGNFEVQVPRSNVAVAARLAGVPAYDMVVVDIADVERFRREAAEARALGYAGKLCVHPDQVAVANKAFVPSPDEVERASRIVQAYDAAVAEGRATVAVDGLMVDLVVARHARMILANARH